MGLLGLVLFLALAYGLSRDRNAIRLSTVLWGLGLQLTLAILVLRTPFGKVFHVIGDAVNRMMLLAETGSQFVFGDLGSSEGPMGIVLAFQILPLIVFVSSLFAVLYYLGIMQQIVRGIAIVMQRVMGASGAESLNMAANIFMGQSEAPLTIRPYLEKLTRSELMTVMTGGMATISGALLVAYVRIGGVPIEHMLTAVIMTAPGAILMAKMLEPETETPETFGTVPRESNADDVNVIDAAARGASEGLYLSLNVGAVLIAFVALIAVLNGLMSWLHGLPYMGWMPEALQDVFAWVFAPVAWVMGVPWSDAGTIGDLLGTADGDQRVRRLRTVGEDSRDPSAAVLLDCGLCALRLCEFRLHRDSGGRHREFDPEPPSRLGEARFSSDAGRHDGELHDGIASRPVGGLRSFARGRL